MKISTRARILSAKVLGTMSENNSRGYLATDPNAGTYGIDTKRGKTYKRRQPREKRGTERGSHSTHSSLFSFFFHNTGLNQAFFRSLG